MWHPVLSEKREQPDAIAKTKEKQTVVGLTKES